MYFYEDTDVDRFEHEVEFDRLGAALTGGGAEELIIRLHASQSCINGDSKLSHLHAVSELAAGYADKYYFEADFNEQSYRKKCCRLAGLLHEAIAAGGDFEEIIDVADERVARIVAALTPDKRLPKPKRYKLYLNQVGLASEAAQLVKLADMQHECFQYSKLPNKLLKGFVLQAVDEAKLETIDILGVLHKLKESMYLAPQFVQLKTYIYEIGQKCKPKAGKQE